MWKTMGILVAILISASVVEAKRSVSILWAEYDGDTPLYTYVLEQAFEEKYPDIDLKIIRTGWNNLHDRLLTLISMKKEPDLSVVGTRWLLALKKYNVMEPMERHLPESLLDNIEPSAMEAKFDNILYGLPMAVVPRLMYYRKDKVPIEPQTFEELRDIAKKIHNPPEFFAVGMVGQKNIENSEFASYLFAGGGDYFKMNTDGSVGTCLVNSTSGIKAVTFMNDLVNRDKLTQPGVTHYGHDELQDLFVTGKLGFF